MSMGMNVGMNMGVGMGVGIPGWHNPGPSFSSPSPRHMRSSPPPVDSSIDDFCDQYKVSLDDRARLDQLGFQIGDNISHIEDQALGVGFRILDWTRIVKNYNKYLRR